MMSDTPVDDERFGPDAPYDEIVDEDGDPIDDFLDVDAPLPTLAELRERQETQ